MERYDVAIIGSGPAGLSAAINLQIRKKSFLLFGTSALSNKIETAPKIDNYLGLPGISGKELQSRFQRHLQQMDIAVENQTVQMVYPMGTYFSLATAKQVYEATAVIIAAGVFTSRLLDGEERFLGKGVGYCATCDAPLYKGKTVAVLGYTEEAVRETNYIAEIARKTYYVPMKNTSLLPIKEVEILGERATGVAGDAVVRQLTLGKADPVEVDGVFILRESIAPTSLIPGIAMKEGYISVDSDMRTSIQGCYAAGDCTGKPHQYMRAAGQGQTAALNAVSYIDLRK